MDAHTRQPGWGYGVIYVRTSAILVFLPVCRITLAPVCVRKHLSFRNSRRETPVPNSHIDLHDLIQMIVSTLGSSFTIQPFSYIGSDATVPIGKWDDEAHIALMCAAAEGGANIEREKYISFALLASKRLMNTMRAVVTLSTSLDLTLEEYPLKLQVLATLVAMGLDVDNDWFRSNTCNYVRLFDIAKIEHPAVRIIVQSGWRHDGSTAFFNSDEQQTRSGYICKQSQEWKKATSQVLSLRCLAANTVRRRLQPNAMAGVKKLEIPDTCKEYITFGLNYNTALFYFPKR